MVLSINTFDVVYAASMPHLALITCAASSGNSQRTLVIEAADDAECDDWVQVRAARLIFSFVVLQFSCCAEIQLLHLNSALFSS